MTLSPSQDRALDQISDWLEQAPPVSFCDSPRCLDLDSEEGRPHTHGSAQEYPVLSVGGLAGTGKTYLLSLLADKLDITVAFGTPTNKAAAVLRRKLDAAQSPRVRTYHSLLYMPKSWHTCRRSGENALELGCHCEASPGECSCPRFRCPVCAKSHSESGKGCPVDENLVFELRNHVGGFRHLVVLDEGSMITEDRVNEIRSLGVPVLVSGDYGQLPPVKGELNPWMRSPELVLEENFRQSEASGIVAAALEARQFGALLPKSWGDGSAVAVDGHSHPEAFDAILPPRLPADGSSAVITWTNASRCNVNTAARASLFGSDAAALAVGDRLVSLVTGERDCFTLKNGRGWKAEGQQELIFNGITGTVAAVISMKEKSAVVLIRLDEGRDGSVPGPVIMDTLALAQLGSPVPLGPHDRPRGTSRWDYAYCLTAHKAQGSEFARVAVLGQVAGSVKARWLYTAMTRAREKLLVILLF